MNIDLIKKWTRENLNLVPDPLVPNLFLDLKDQQISSQDNNIYLVYWLHFLLQVFQRIEEVECVEIGCVIGSYN